MARHAFSHRRPSMLPGHRDVAAGFVQEHQAIAFKAFGRGEKRFALLLHAGSVSLGRDEPLLFS